MRLKFYLFLRERVYRLGAGEAAPLSLWVIGNILFPVRYIMEKQRFLKYDLFRDTYWIDGVQMSGSFVRGLKNIANNGLEFQLFTDGKDNIGMKRIERPSCVNAPPDR